MSWPIDPAKRAAALERHRAAQQKRWDAEARDKVRARSLVQWSDVEARRRMSEIKKQFYVDHPGARKAISRRQMGVNSPASESRIDGLIEAWKRRKAIKANRRNLIQERALRVLGCDHVAPQSP